MENTEPNQVTPLSVRRVYSGRLLNVDAETVRNPAGQEIELELVRHPGAAAIVPLLSDETAADPHILLIRQYRYAVDGMIWEIPAGVLDPGEDPETCAKRELLEETGATAERMERLTTIFTTPGFTDERIHLFLATGLEISEPDHQPDEFIKVQPRPLSKVLEMIRDGEIQDGKTITALLYVAGFRLNM
jgi:ADP-ribose diphosphatase